MLWKLWINVEEPEGAKVINKKHLFIPMFINSGLE